QPAAPRVALTDGPLLVAIREGRNGSKKRGYLSKEHYGDLRSGVVELLSRYPARNNFFVAIGRSPTPIVAFLQNLQPNLAISIPGSGLKAADGGVVDAPVQAAWMQHLGTYLP